MFFALGYVAARVQALKVLGDEPVGWCGALSPYVTRGTCLPLLTEAALGACCAWRELE
jgi:hypothetical protein